MPTHFQVYVSEETKKVALTKHDPDTNLFKFPEELGLAPLTQDQYDELMEAFASKRDAAREEFARLKQVLIKEAIASGDAVPKLQFDDALCRIDIEYGFKEFMDRFPKGREAIKKIVVKSDQDKRPYQDIFRDELATPATKASYASLKDDSVNSFRRDGYKDPKRPVDPSGAKTPKAAAGEWEASTVATRAIL